MALHIDENNQTKIILIAIKRVLIMIYGDDLYPKVCPVLLASNFIGITKTGFFLGEVFDRFSINSKSQGLIITLGMIGYSTRSTYSLGYP